MILRKKNVLAAAAAVMLVALWLCAVYRINRKVPRAKQIVYENDQWVSWKDGLEMKVKNGSFMEDAAIRGNENVTEEMFFRGEMKLLWTEIEIRNTGQTKMTFDCMELGAEASGWANIPNMSFYYALNEEGSGLREELEPGESTAYTLPFLLLKTNFRGCEWKKAEDKEYYITFSLYPEKKMIPVKTR